LRATDDENASKSRSSDAHLRDLQAPFFLAPQMGRSLGRGPLLLGQVPAWQNHKV
jgi:hypothetical protein